MARNKPPISCTRKLKKRRPFPKTLVLCEGEKTENFYFSDLRKDLRISKSLLRVIGGVNPANMLVEITKQNNEVKKNNEDPYELFICVFDRDKLDNLEQILQ